MTVEELLKKRKRLEDDILKLILKFESETDIMPTSVYIVKLSLPDKPKAGITVKMEF